MRCFVAAAAQPQCTLASGFQACFPVGFAQAQYAQAGPAGLLRVLAGIHHTPDEFLGSWPGPGSPFVQSFRRALPGLAVRFRHVGRYHGMVPLLLRTPMTGDPLAPVETLDHVARDAHLDLPFDQGMGHRVVVALDRDVIIDVHAGLLPFRIDVGLRRQRLECRLIQLLEVLSAATGELSERRALSLSNSSPMAALSSRREKNWRWRSAARIQRSTTSSPLSTLALLSVTKCKFAGTVETGD